MRHRLVMLLGLLFSCSMLTTAQPMPTEMNLSTWEAAVKQGKWIKAATIWQKMLEQRDWRFQQSREEVQLQLVQAKRQLQCAEEARAIVLDLLAAHPSDSWTCRALWQLTAIAAEAGGAGALDATFRYILDDPMQSAPILQEYLSNFTAGAIQIDNPRPVRDALLRYLEIRPGHPLYWQIRLAVPPLTAAAGEYAEALKAARQILMETAGNPVEVGASLLVAKEEAALGNYDRAGDVICELTPFYPVNTTNSLTALSYYRRAGDLTKTAEIATALTKTTLPQQAVEALFWAGQVAVAHGDKEHAQQWLGTLIAAAPEHPRAFDARDLLWNLTKPPNAK